MPNTSKGKQTKKKGKRGSQSANPQKGKGGSPPPPPSRGKKSGGSGSGQATKRQKRSNKGGGKGKKRKAPAQKVAETKEVTAKAADLNRKVADKKLNKLLDSTLGAVHGYKAKTVRKDIKTLEPVFEAATQPSELQLDGLDGYGTCAFAVAFIVLAIRVFVRPTGRKIGYACWASVTNTKLGEAVRDHLIEQWDNLDLLDPPGYKLTTMHWIMVIGLALACGLKALDLGKIITAKRLVKKKLLSKEEVKKLRELEATKGAIKRHRLRIMDLQRAARKRFREEMKLIDTETARLSKVEEEYGELTSLLSGNLSHKEMQHNLIAWKKAKKDNPDTVPQSVFFQRLRDRKAKVNKAKILQLFRKLEQITVATTKAQTPSVTESVLEKYELGTEAEMDVEEKSEEEANPLANLQHSDLLGAEMSDDDSSESDRDEQ